MFFIRPLACAFAVEAINGHRLTFTISSLIVGQALQLSIKSDPDSDRSSSQDIESGDQLYESPPPSGNDSSEKICETVGDSLISVGDIATPHGNTHPTYVFDYEE